MTDYGYRYETSETAAHFTDGRQGREITGVTIHWWGTSKTLDFDGIVNFLCSARPANPSSAHYVAQGVDQHGKRSRRVSCIVDPDDTAWHAGNWGGNLATVGVECRPHPTDEDYDVVAEVVARLWNTYPKANGQLYPHKFWTATQCPGDWDLAKLRRLVDAKKKALASGSVVVPKPTPKPKPAPVPAPAAAAGIVTVREGDTLSAIAAATKTTVANLAKWNGIRNPDMITVGQKIRVTAPAPASKPAPKPATPSRPWLISNQKGVYLDKLRPGATASTSVYLYQLALRRYLHKYADKYNPSGATGNYGPETVAMTQAVYRDLAKKAGGNGGGWATKNKNGQWVSNATWPGKSLLGALGITILGAKA